MVVNGSDPGGLLHKRKPELDVNSWDAVDVQEVRKPAVNTKRRRKASPQALKEKSLVAIQSADHVQARSSYDDFNYRYVSANVAGVDSLLMYDDVLPPLM